MADVSGQSILIEAALKRLDPYVKKVIDTAKFVALYKFRIKESKWEKTGVEGPLFVYSRTGEPYHNILVLNRLSTDNLIEPIGSRLILQPHEPFLLYLNAKRCLYGLWFYERDDCVRVSSLIEKLARESSGKTSVPGSASPRMNGTAVDICNMLSRAQEAYNTSKMGSARSEVNGSDQTPPQSVMEFFAKAGSASKTVPLPAGQRSPSEDRDKMNPLIHQLMTNPVHLVEHIEKQQRMVTPQASEVPDTKILNTLIVGQGERGEKVPNGVSVPVPPVSPSALSALLNHTESAMYPIADTPKKPALMPPAMFTPQSRKESLSENENDDFKLEPLTRNQLFQAINYLLRNDPVFMTKIHEAYVKSLTDKVL